MKAVSMTAVTIVVYLLLASLFPVGGPTPEIEPQAGVIQTAVLGISNEKDSSGPLTLPTTIVPALPPATPDALSGVLSANVAEGGNSEVEVKGVPVSSYGLLDAAALSVPEATLAVPTSQPAAPFVAPVPVDEQLETFAASVINGQPDQVVGVVRARCLCAARYTAAGRTGKLRF